MQKYFAITYISMMTVQCNSKIPFPFKENLFSLMTFLKCYLEPFPSKPCTSNTSALSKLKNTAFSFKKFIRCAPDRRHMHTNLYMYCSL